MSNKDTAGSLRMAIEILKGLVETEPGLVHPVGDGDCGIDPCWWCDAKRFIGKPEGWQP